MDRNREMVRKGRALGLDAGDVADIMRDDEAWFRFVEPPVTRREVPLWEPNPIDRDLWRTHP